MKDICIKAVSDAAGRSLKADELKDLEKTIRTSMRTMARMSRDAWTAMSPADQLTAAAKFAGQKFMQMAKREKFLVARKIISYDKIDNAVRQNVERGNTRLKSLDSYGFIDTSGKTTGQSWEDRRNAIKGLYESFLVKTYETMNRKVFGLFANPQGVRALAYEMFGQDSSQIAGIDPELAKLAKQGAKGWRATTDMAREAFNRLGGAIGDLGDNWHLPQNWSSARVLAMGKEPWVGKMMDRVDRKQYVNEDGSLFTDEQMQKTLRESWDTIATKGAIRMEPEKAAQGGSMLANRLRDPRVLFFKDADSYLDANAEFGGSTIYDAMQKHINMIAGNTALLEHFGPNPTQMFKNWVAKSLKEDMLADPANAAKYESQAANLQKKFDWATSSTIDKPVSLWMAKAADVLRDTMTASKLGIAPITSANHLATMNLTASYLGLDHMQMMRNYFAALDPTNTMEESLAQRFGLSMETYTNEMNHWAKDNLGPAFTKYLAGASVRFSGLAAHLDAMRRAFGVTMYGSLGSLAKNFDSIDAMKGKDADILRRNGISDTNFAVWKLAQAEDWGSGNSNMITPETISAIPDEQIAHLGNPSDVRRDAILNMMGMVNREVQNAVITPTTSERFNATGQFKRGTVMGELGRSIYMFKMVPQAQVARNMARGMNMPTLAGKAGYIAAYVAATTAVSAMVVQMKNLAAGKDPQAMLNKQFLTDTLLKGGALGIYADFVLSSGDQDPNESLTDKVGGPMVGLANDLYKLVHQTGSKFLSGQESNPLPELARIAHNNVPLLQTWYTKAIMDRLIFNQLQEYLSPGYMDRVKETAAQNGTPFFMQPNSPIPTRAPDFGRALDEE